MAFQPIYAIRDRHRRGTLLPYKQGIDDGSTLTLDFTKGQLDPRLSFTRASNATLINSQGYVEWAAANTLSNSVLAGASGATPPTGWLVSFIGGTGNFTLNGTELTISNNGSATRSRIYQTGSNGNGLFVTVQLKVVANNTSGMALVELLSFAINGAGSVTYKVNGSTQLPSFTGWVAGDTVTLTCIPTVGVAATCLFGLGASGAVSTSASVTIKDIQIEPGSVARSYIPTTTSGAYQAPRFDYDPTTLAPRGLLIEGSAVNLLFWSESFATSGAASNWAYSSNTGAVVTTDNPAGGTTAFQFAETVNGGPLLQSVTVTNAVHTFSAWFKGSTYNSVTTTQVQFGLYTTAFVAGSASIISGPGSTSIAGNIVTLSGLSTTQWTRVQFTTSAAISGGVVAILIYPQSTSFEVNRSFYIWGSQIELGSGASSYIPTGASQGQRLADSCVMTGTNFSSWFAGATEGVLYAEVERPTKIASPAADHGVVSTLYTSGTWLGLQMTTTNQYPSSVLWPSGGFVSAGGIATRVPLVGKQAVRWFDGNDITNFANGVQGATGTGTGTMVPTLLTIGANVSTGTTANLDWLNGCIRRVKFWPTALPNAQIIALTT